MIEEYFGSTSEFILCIAMFIMSVWSIVYGIKLNRMTKKAKENKKKLKLDS